MKSFASSRFVPISNGTGAVEPSLNAARGSTGRLIPSTAGMKREPGASPRREDALLG